jgi:hypothetical protein
VEESDDFKQTDFSEMKQDFKIKKVLNKEGVQPANVTRTLRARQPTNQLISNKGERVIFSSS